MATIGLIGAGHIGSQLARLAVKSGYDAVLSNSRGPQTLAGLVKELGPKARAGTTAEAAKAGDIVVVTVPLKSYRQVPVEPLVVPVPRRPTGPVTLMVHMASVWVPFTSESKEAIASYPEIMKELRLALQAVGRKLGMYLNQRKRVRQEGERREIFLRYLGEVARGVEDLEDLAVSNPAPPSGAIKILPAERAPAHAVHHLMVAMAVLADFVMRENHVRLNRCRLLFEESRHRRNLLGPRADEQIGVRPNVPRLAKRCRNRACTDDGAGVAEEAVAVFGVLRMFRRGHANHGCLANLAECRQQPAKK